MDIDEQAGTKGLKYAAGKGLAVVVMEPIRGGRLSGSVPPTVQAIWDEAPVQRTPAEWALQWVWNQPEVSLLLSGMSAMEHVVENVESAGRSGAGSMSDEELALWPACARRTGPCARSRAPTASTASPARRGSKSRASSRSIST